jgi:UMF1 family MFS transporter
MSQTYRLNLAPARDTPSIGKEMLEAKDFELRKKKSVRAWAMYDFAGQGYQVTTASALFPAYFARGIAPEGLTILGLHFPAEALWGFGIGIAAAIVFILSPVLGAIADFGAHKKRFLMSFAYGGCLFASLLFFAQEGMVWFSLILFILAQISFTSGNVFYDSFLPHLVPEKDIDSASGLGFAYGYLGGTLQFGFALALVSGHDWVGLSEAMAIRISLLSAGLWWLFFSTYTFIHLKEDRSRAKKANLFKTTHLGVQKTFHTLKQIPKFPSMLLFLIAFFFYNDGIQTVISIAGVYASGTLKLSTESIMITFLIVQFVAIGGALGFSFLAKRLGTKKALILGLGAWCGIVIAAFFLKEGQATGFIILGALIGLILGGTQALSRSLFASIVPIEASAGFFGFYSVFNKLSAILGPILFGLMTTIMGSARPAVLMILIFFIIGTGFLFFVDLKKARAARLHWELS